jgi:uncharacterized protein (TIGR00369 family)
VPPVSAKLPSAPRFAYDTGGVRSLLVNEDIVRGMIAGSPYATLLGIELEHVGLDEVRLRLPFRNDVTTIADVVHGGALSSLIDTAATAAAWSGASLDGTPRGTTIALTVNFLAAARGQDVVATGRVIRRGRSIVYCEVDVTAPDGTSCARALITYKLG